jgi:hypothetical protein
VAEIITLTTPLPETSTLRIADFDLNVRGSMIRVVFAEYAASVWVPNGREIIVSWNGPTADALMLALNKANLTTQSLAQRVFAQAITDGKLIGTQSGTVP